MRFGRIAHFSYHFEAVPGSSMEELLETLPGPMKLDSSIVVIGILFEQVDLSTVDCRFGRA